MGVLESRHPYRRQRFVPRVEALEDRTVPAVSITQEFNAVFVTGDHRANTVKIIDDGTNGANAITIQADGLSRTFAGTVRRIIVDTGQQNDQVTYHLTGDLQAGVERHVESYLGQGKDTFNADIDGNLLAGSLLRIRVHGNEGKDRLTVDATNGGDGVNVMANALLRVYMDGKQGKDTIALDFRGQVLGEFWSQLEGENGKDRIGTTIALDDGSTGTVRAWVLGMNGRDDLKLDISGPGVSDLDALFARLDGGLGRDSASASPGVLMQNVP